MGEARQVKSKALWEQASPSARRASGEKLPISCRKGFMSGRASAAPDSRCSERITAASSGRSCNTHSGTSATFLSDAPAPTRTHEPTRKTERPQTLSMISQTNRLRRSFGRSNYPPSHVLSIHLFCRLTYYRLLLRHCTVGAGHLWRAFPRSRCGWGRSWRCGIPSRSACTPAPPPASVPLARLHPYTCAPVIRP